MKPGLSEKRIRALTANIPMLLAYQSLSRHCEAIAAHTGLRCQYFTAKDSVLCRFHSKARGKGTQTVEQLYSQIAYGILRADAMRAPNELKRHKVFSALMERHMYAHAGALTHAWIIGDAAYWQEVLTLVRGDLRERERGNKR